MHVLVVIAAALPLCGCGAGVSYIMDEYRGTEVKSFAVGSVDDGNYEDTYRIFDKPDKNKLMITPSLGAAAGIGMARGATFGGVNPEAPKPVYERAALAYLTSTGRKCRALDTYMLVTPQWEVKYDCSIPPPPVAMAEPPKRRR